MDIYFYIHKFSKFLCLIYNNKKYITKKERKKDIVDHIYVVYLSNWFFYCMCNVQISLFSFI